jgi:hypothetical protein
MAKKKLKKLLKGLGIGAALLGAGKALMNKNSAANVNSGRGGTSSSAIARKLANMEEPVYQDDIMRGGSGVKNMRKIPGMMVEGDRYSMFDSMGFKKGGKVRKTKKGGRAVKKASRSKKK